jgi:chemotaxis protein methyltransferase CheR
MSQSGAAGSPRRARAKVEILGAPPLTDQELALFQRLIYDEAGIHLSSAKRALLIARLSGRLRALKLSTFSAYYRRITTEGDAEELQRMLDCISTNETHFFREPKHFDLLERKIIPAWIAQADRGERPRRIRVWSAACSTGEEPFSIAMQLLHHLPSAAGWIHEILATDLSTRVLERAKSAVFSLEKASEIPKHYLKTFMLRGTGDQEGNMKADDALRSIVRFHRLNLNDESYGVTGRFDLIFCRNVLIYFNADSRRRTIGRLLSYLAPDGYFFVGHAESLHGVTSEVRSIMPTVYVFASALRGGRAPPKTA